jgi:hypothetical protein
MEKTTMTQQLFLACIEFDGCHPRVTIHHTRAAAEASIFERAREAGAAAADLASLDDATNYLIHQGFCDAWIRVGTLDGERCKRINGEDFF